MSATLERPTETQEEETQDGKTDGKTPTGYRSREQVAAELLTLLTKEPQSEAALRRRLGSHAGSGKSDAVRSALQVLDSRHEARRIPNTAGSKRGGWVRYDAPYAIAAISGEEVEFPYEWAILPVNEMFIDKDYQRPITSFVDRIVANFDPVLFQTLAINKRNRKDKPYAIIDGQTRWQGAQRRGIQMVPCIMFTGLSPEQEADIFWRLQKERKGMISWHRFRAALKAKRPEAIAIHNMVTSIGYEMGDGQGQMKAVAALEACWRRDEFALERTLGDLRTAWPDTVPEAPFIRGMHYFFLHFPIDDKSGRKRNEEVDDERLVNRLRAAGPDGVRKKAINVREYHDKKLSAARLYGEAIQTIYTGRR